MRRARNWRPVRRRRHVTRSRRDFSFQSRSLSQIWLKEIRKRAELGEDTRDILDVFQDAEHGGGAAVDDRNRRLVDVEDDGA